MLRAVGSLFLLLGLALGGMLVLAPFGLVEMKIGAAPSFLFTVFVGAGYLLVAVASRLAQIQVLTRLLGAALLLLAAGAALGLFRLVTANATLANEAQVAWVLLVAVVFGASSMIALRPAAAR